MLYACCLHVSPPFWRGPERKLLGRVIHSNIILAASSPLTRWEQIGEKTRWGRYLAEVEERAILQAEGYAGLRTDGIDLGCGGGRWSKLLSDRGWNMTCVDVDPEALKICEHKLPGAKCILSQPTDTTIPAPSASAAIALCIEAAPLVESEWFAGEVYRVLQTGGILIGVSINGRSLRGFVSRMKDRIFDRQSDYGFYEHSYGVLRKRLLDGGFEMIHEESFCWGPFKRDSDSLLVPAWTRLERSLRLPRLIRWAPWIVFIARKN